MKSFVFLLLLATAVAAEEPRRYIVEFGEGRGLRVASQFRVDAPRAEVRHEFRHVLDAMAIELREGESVDAIRKLPYVARVTPDAVVTAFDFGAEGARLRMRGVGTTATGAGVVVAVIDSGIDYRHPALGSGFGAGKKVAGGWDFVNDDEDPLDDYRHGTHVAGIIAASGARMNGIAPGATLLAYKVLDQRGQGLTSDTIAALERALDPNGDGDLSDRADIANLSLGSPGHPDDPMARAVERAVAAGMVVCAAAGNEGAFHIVSSPGVAESAITVGAVHGGSVAEFSSRGPAMRSGAIKPDLLAPGVNIESTLPNGAYGNASGTSMATPHVAALAALLVEQHPEWTPVRIKSALVANASPLANEEVMAQGSGAVDAMRAFASDLLVAPTQLNFGNDGTTAAMWQSVRTLHVKNESDAPRTIAAVASGATAGIAIAVPEPFTLAAGESREIEFRVTVDNAVVTRPVTSSLSFGGLVRLAWDGGAVHVPWAFVRAARAVVTYDGAFPAVIWDVPIVRYQSHALIGPAGSEMLVEPGSYDLAVITEHGGIPRVIASEGRRVEGDVLVALGPQDAPHEVRLDALPGRESSDTSLYAVRARLIAPGGSVVLPMPGRVLHSATLSERFTLLFTESFVDLEAREIRVAQHEPLRGVASHRVLSRQPADFAAQPLVLHAPDGSSGREVRVMPRDWPRAPNQFGPQPPSISASFTEPSWSGTLYMTAEPHPDFASGVQLQLRVAGDDAGLGSYFTPVIRRDANGFFSQRAFERSEAPTGTLSGEPLEFGAGATHLPGPFVANASGLAVIPDLHGDRDEVRRRETEKMLYRIVDRATGEELAKKQVPYGLSFIPLARAAAMTATFSAGDVQIAGGKGTASLDLHYDTRRGETRLPSITSLAILDGVGRHAARLARDGNGSLVFSLRDANGVGVFFRPLGRTTWIQLTPVATGEAMYRVDLADALRFDGAIELRIEALGENDSAAVWQLAPAFLAERTEGKRRRAVR